MRTTLIFPIRIADLDFYKDKKDNDKIGLGWGNAKQYLKDHSAECKKIVAKLKKYIPLLKAQ